MSGDVHVRICERVGVQFPRATRLVILVNGTQVETIDVKNKVQGHLGVMGLTLSEEKTRITHWEKPITFLGYHIQGKLRARGVQIRAILTIPKEKERAIERELLKVASFHHIPELDAILTMNAKFRGWTNYYKYANNPQTHFGQLSKKMWWLFAHFLARKHRMSISKLITWADKSGIRKVVRKGDRQRKTFSYQVGKKEYHLDLFPPKTAEIRTVTNKESWSVDLKVVNFTNWIQGRSAATQLSALA